MNTSEKRFTLKHKVCLKHFFFCRRDCSRRDGISKQQAYGTSYCWQIPSRRLKGKQAEESKGLLPLCSSFWYEIWYSFWYDGSKKLLFLNFVIFSPITYAEKQSVIIASKWYMTIVSKSTILYLPSFRYDIWLSFWNEENKNMIITLIWHRFRQSANQSAGTKIFKTQNFNLQIFITKQSLWMQFFVHRICFVENIFFRLQNLIWPPEISELKIFCRRKWSFLENWIRHILNCGCP